MGLVLVATGAIVWALGKLGFKGLPGDFVYSSGNVKIYVPIVTCLALSVVISLIVWLVRLLAR